MDTLFTEAASQASFENAPLAVRMRPRTLDEMVGQSEVLGPGSWLRGAIENDTLSSIILFGPAGTGKTTLARVIAQLTTAHFTEVSAISGGVSDLRRVIDEAAACLTHRGVKTILFVDEIHRFSRSQQDALLHAVENRTVVLIGATTENPAFEVNSALLSRSRVIAFAPLLPEDLALVLERALAHEKGLAGTFTLGREARDAIVLMAAGDARSALTTLELAAEQAAHTAGRTLSALGLAAEQAVFRASVSSEETASLPTMSTAASIASSTVTSTASSTAVSLEITLENVRQAAPRTMLPYDKKGDQHYDVISAFIKSMRGSDPDAAVYWLARMLDGGEDPKFIARRILICASEDIGNADPQALLVAHAAFAAVERIGLPECRINLAQAAVYLALAPKSNASYLAIDSALAEVRTGPLRAVPNHLRDRHRPGSEHYGRYRYPHDEASGYALQRYLPDGLEAGAFYRPGDRGWEAYRTEQRLRDKAQPSTTPPDKPQSGTT